MLTSHLSPDATTLTITPGGRFDFRIHHDFRNAYAKRAVAPHYVINLGQTDYLDSSALGMLLLLREYAGGDKADIRILNCKPEVRTIFNVANFQQLFALS